jgi:restriction system protein
MPIPDYQTIMLPLLQFCSDGKDHSLGEAVDHVASLFHLTQEEKDEQLPSGKQTLIRNRVHWAKTYLYKANLLNSPRRGHFQITERGMEVLKERLDKITARYLMRFSEFTVFKERKTEKKQEVANEINDTSLTPAEALENAHSEIRQNLASEVLENIKKCTPEFFEHLVLEVLVEMGYGGSRSDAASMVGKSGDEGIDGIIKEDRLGLDVIYIQAKRWDATVGRPEIQKFVGALQGQRAKKGVFITTSDFSKDALEYVRHLDCKVVLIDGEQLANLMIDNNIGVSRVAMYEVKRLDSDYFSEE